MSTPASPIDVDVLIVGCGPVGALTANLLGRRGVSTLVVERSREPHGQPRAFSCDDEALRIYQQAGLLAEVSAGMRSAPVVDYTDGAGRPFAEIALSEVDFGLGHPPLQFFDQPRLEHALRTGLGRFPHVALRLGVELEALHPGDGGVTARIRDLGTGLTREVHARYVLGCDGARSTTRALAGIGLRGSTYEEPWLAVSGDLPADAVRLDRTRFVCDWRRPAFVSPAADGGYRLEFMLRAGETAARLEHPAAVAELVAPYVDPARFQVRRAAVYTFNHLVADRWRAGRVFLLGDAAHQMPPFMGQGLCSGLRDAANLVWKLDLVLAGIAEPDLLDTYEQERRPHTEEMAAITVRVGRVFLARSRAGAKLRDLLLRGVQLVPRVRRFVRHFEFKPLPVHRRGWHVGARPAGTMFPQPRVAVPGSALPVPLDDVLGGGFALIGPEVSPAVAADPRWHGMPVRFIRVCPAGTAPAITDGDYREVADVDGRLTAWFARHRAGVAVLRPDRFVYGVAGDSAAAELGRTLAGALRAGNRTAASPPRVG
ncbi:bifunctional 3-(3-hydroxy-phenyl)propionate/3-hydroxycinnamic acid hydroxylase [Catellatospora sichuanensis]|uniref:bifunctional 3-(3-hydroxy-phenyl)propionate/3-hydroxycinnamic acid hydroxylase MhpA n=1 Tax=Catellatospora sichuanensis TaxID=1969805 RepID=UPI001FE6E2D9|nr:bifunctional 3-(3-hydroxy-phenyl)propionate/3-hydroxycinnamic acid hydroxylase [Catellatospora sichuanensis]